ncbi:MAG: protoporphyrinogen oxidase [Ardenticatenaceae bacterium]|nr:protoporphyrinogen oxidase [Ardenticatenaceae bacterium]MCB8987402.1 protoporphyrinogen oxidase [Ardenticatenaceae bacterium]
MDTNFFDVVIVGGGITGLSAAWYLQQERQAGERPFRYALLEQTDRWGGKIATETITGLAAEPFVVEAGPDSFITQKPWGLELARALGLQDDLLPTNDGRRQTFVLHKGQPTPLPDGVMMIVPTKITPFALSPLLSPLGKLRMGLDLFIPPKTDGADETLAEFIERRLGAEALDKIAEPLMSGIYNAEAERQSLLATFPRFRDIEEKHGSLIKGMLAGKKARASRSPSANGRSAAPTSMFMSLQGGMADLPAALQAQLTGECLLETAVTSIETGDWISENLPSPVSDLPSPTAYTLTLDNGRILTANTVILAVPAHVAAQLLGDVAPDAAAGLVAIRYVSTGTISLAYRRDEIDHPLNGFGVVIPRSENRPINAITWTSTKFDRRAPEGYALLRVFFGGSRNPQMMDVDDGELVETVRRELAEIMSITAVPVFHRIYRWRQANPQYDVGHLERVAAIEAALPAGIFVTGSPYRGIGIPDCVRQAQQTAQQVILQLSAASSKLQTESSEV